jgi:hypothetical protein
MPQPAALLSADLLLKTSADRFCETPCVVISRFIDSGGMVDIGAMRLFPAFNSGAFPQDCDLARPKQCCSNSWSPVFSDAGNFCEMHPDLLAIEVSVQYFERFLFMIRQDFLSITSLCKRSQS